MTPSSGPVDFKECDRPGDHALLAPPLIALTDLREWP
jgi:hypothetical protein